MSKIMITGDTHRTTDIDKVYQLAEQEGLTKDDYLIVCGDFGVIWSSYTRGLEELSEDDKNLIKVYDRFPFTTLFVDGNHENHTALNKFEVSEWNGGKVHKIGSSLYHLMRGQVFTIYGKKFFTMGGARSIDKAYRQPEVSWWAGEMPTYNEYDEAIRNLEVHNFKVDYVLTHDCPFTCLKKVSIYPNRVDELENFLERLQFTYKLDFKHWYFGHFHLDKQLDDKHTCLYDNIVTIE